MTPLREEPSRLGVAATFVERLKANAGWTELTYTQAIESESGETYETLSADYERAFEECALIFGPPTRETRGPAYQDVDRKDFPAGLVDGRTLRVCWWDRPDLLTAILLGSHDADTLRSLTLVVRQR